ncbi:MAG: DUF4157 domain-containing protein [Chloroflexi bacterium]|nr:DUF4157 domain-containing protein [Chloroflexota bacterium]
MRPALTPPIAQAAPPIGYGLLPTAGQPLDPFARSIMEPRFGHDFSRVRVHTDPVASSSARALGASAYTQGHNIIFGAGRFAPQTRDGQRLLAHELTHVVQYEHYSARQPDRATASLEQEAAAASLLVSAGFPIRIQHAAQPRILKDDEAHGARLGPGGGALVGAIFGGAIGTIIGGLFGGIGALVGLGIGMAAGAIAGAIGGAINKNRPVKPSEADTLIRRQYGGNLVDAIAAGIQAEGRIQVVDDAQYRVAYQNRYGSIDEDYPNVNAFVDRSTTPPTVWIHQDRQRPTTVLHEAMHLYSNAAVRTTYGSQVNEGITEYFTRQIVREQNLPDRSGIYDSEYAEVNALVEICGEDVLRRAYFEGDIAGLESAVDTARSAGTFATWVAAMQAEDWAAARAALAAPAPAPAPAPVSAPAPATP